MTMPTIVSAAVRDGLYVRSGTEPLRHGIIVTKSGQRMMVLCDRIRLQLLGKPVEQSITCARCLRALRKMGRALA